MKSNSNTSAIVLAEVFSEDTIRYRSIVCIDSGVFGFSLNNADLHRRRALPAEIPGFQGSINGNLQEFDTAGLESPIFFRNVDAADINIIVIVKFSREFVKQLAKFGWNGLHCVKQ